MKVLRSLMAGAAIFYVAPAFANFSFAPSGGTTMFAVDGSNQGTSLCAAASTECAATVPINTAGTPIFTSSAPGSVNVAQMGGTAIASGCTAALNGFSSSIPSTVCGVFGSYVLNALASVNDNADAVAVATPFGSPVVAHNFIFNGTTYDRARSGGVTGMTGVTAQATPSGGSSTTGNIAANNTTAVVVKASAGTLYGVQLYGIGSAPAYLKLYNATSATCGSGTPVKRLMIPAAATAANGAGSNVVSFPGVNFGTGITYCVTTGITDADTTAPAASTFLINLDWQ